MAYSDTYSPDYKKAYEAALGNVATGYQTKRDDLIQQQQALPYQYQQQKNAVSNQAAQTARSYDETNAQRGLYNSGDARTDLARNNATRDQGINAISNTQLQASNALKNQVNQLNAQEASAIAGIQGQEGQDLRNYDLSKASLMGNLNGAPTAAQSQYSQNLALQQAAQNSDISSQNFNNKLALLSALQGFNINQGQITDTYAQPTNYTYGDYMPQLLAALAAMS